MSGKNKTVIRKFKKSLVEDMGFDVPKTNKRNWTNRKKKDKNSQKYVDWILRILNEEVYNCHYWKLRSIFLQEKLVVNPMAVYINENNNDVVLHQCIDPMTWLDISPRTDDTLSDDEYSVDYRELMAPPRG